MDLDDVFSFSQLDPENYAGHIRETPDQIRKGWEIARNFKPSKSSNFKQVVLWEPAVLSPTLDMITSYLNLTGSRKVLTTSDSRLPLAINRESDLVIIFSLNENDRNFLSFLDNCRESDCYIIGITSNKCIFEIIREDRLQIIDISFIGPERAALGLAFALPLGLIYKVGLTHSPENDINSLVELLKKNQKIITLESPLIQNPAKRLAGQFFDRWVTIISSETMLPAAKWWKTQINLNAKAWAQVDRISDTCTITSNGILNPESLLNQMMAIFINSPCDRDWEKHYLDATRRLFMVEGVNTDFYQAFGNSLLENIWTAIQFGDYVSYYLAMAYGVDPTPIPSIDEINPIMD